MQSSEFLSTFDLSSVGGAEKALVYIWSTMQMSKFLSDFDPLQCWWCRKDPGVSLHAEGHHMAGRFRPNPRFQREKFRTCLNVRRSSAAEPNHAKHVSVRRCRRDIPMWQCARRLSPPPCRTGAAWAGCQSAPGGWDRTPAAACCASPSPAQARRFTDGKPPGLEEGGNHHNWMLPQPESVKPFHACPVGGNQTCTFCLPHAQAVQHQAYHADIILWQSIVDRSGMPNAPAAGKPGVCRATRHSPR